jgi:protein-S-isoprenylcysteine O-methyltransferase Ste14
MMQALENRIPPPLVLAIAAALMRGLTVLFPATSVPDAFRLVLAGVVAVIGLAIVVQGARTFGRAGTTINPVNIEAASSLVTSGVFRYSRNPMYVGFTAMLVGWAICLSSPTAFLGPIAFALFINRFQIIPEERAMRAKFGAAYDAYRQIVRRWV